MRSSAVALAFLHAAVVSASAPNWDLHYHGMVDDFKWQRPFPDDGTPLNGFDVPCEAIQDFHARQYKLSDMHVKPPQGLSPWSQALNYLMHSRAYPGSWDGANLKGDNRDVILFEYKDVPPPVREWLDKEFHDEAESKRRFMGLYDKPDKKNDDDKVLLIAPGELYDILPLWVAHGSKCESKRVPARCFPEQNGPLPSKTLTPLPGDFKNLSRYYPEARDGGIVAWPILHKHIDREEGTDERDIHFKVDARVVIETEDGKAARRFWERAQANLAREQRRQLKKEREGNRDHVDGRRGHDEL